MTKIAENDFLRIYIERILPRIVLNGDCCECTIGDNGKGYRTVHVRPTVYYAHRVTYQAYFGDIPEGLGVLHKCDNRACCNPYHLFVGTQKDNMQDKMRKGRAIGPKLMGENNPAAKLTWEMVREIRKNSESTKDAAKKYGVAKQNIRLIRRNMLWSE